MRTVQTWTGWFSDKQCARTPAAGESVRPNGTECVKKCLNEGSAPVFLSEQANAIYDVQNHTSVKDDVGYRVASIRFRLAGAELGPRNEPRVRMARPCDDIAVQPDLNARTSSLPRKRCRPTW